MEEEGRWTDIEGKVASVLILNRGKQEDEENKRDRAKWNNAVLLDMSIRSRRYLDGRRLTFTQPDHNRKQHPERKGEERPEV